MLALRGIYNGKTIKLLDKISERKKYKVIITFLEEIKSTDTDLRDFTAQTNGLDFWENPEENIYQDYLQLQKDKR
jgi:hypothetical protein